MDNELQQMKRGYQEIKAPQHLQARIRAEVANTRVRSWMWTPAAVSVTAIAAILWIAPLGWIDDGTTGVKPAKPSLSALAALRPTKPTVSVPSLARVNTVTVPRMPARPVPVRITNAKSK